MEPADVVLRFLESVGRPEEARFYLDLFRETPREQFAAIHVDANVMADAADAVVLDLKFLAALDLFPTVLLGLFQPADAHAHARRLRRRLEAAGVQAVLLEADADLATRARDAARRGVVPVVAFASLQGEQASDRFTRLARVLADLATRKLIFLHRPGGLRLHGSPLPLVNLSEDVPALLASKDLNRKEQLLLEQSRQLVLGAPHALTVAVTSPLNLLRELFTVKGAGTLMRRGAVIVRHDGWTGVDRDRVRAILSSSFGREPSEAVFERNVRAVYREEDWRGVAILVDTPLGAYLSKFAVSPRAQGEGMARELWDALVADHPVVFWRARAGNPIGEWYARLADGLVRLPEWTVFWKGLAVERIPDAIAWALAQPADIPPPA
jgi:acetylglutamate kinase